MFIIVTIIIFFVLYYVIRYAVEEGTYRALKRYDETKKNHETMMEIGGKVQKERNKNNDTEGSSENGL